MATSGKFRRFRWVFLLLVVIDVLNAPRAIRGMVEICKENHWLIVPTFVALCMAIGLNWLWLFLCFGGGIALRTKEKTSN